MTAHHPHFCECSDCLNRGGGARYDGAGRVHETARQKHNRQQREFSKRQKDRRAQRAQRAAKAVL